MWKHCMPVGEWYFGDVHREIEHFILKLYYVKDSGFKKKPAGDKLYGSSGVPIYNKKKLIKLKFNFHFVCS